MTTASDVFSFDSCQVSPLRQTTAAATSMACTESHRQLTDEVHFLDKPIGDGQKSGRCDLLVNEYSAFGCVEFLRAAATEPIRQPPTRQNTPSDGPQLLNPHRIKPPRQYHTLEKGSQFWILGPILGLQKYRCGDWGREGPPPPTTTSISPLGGVHRIQLVETKRKPRRKKTFLSSLSLSSLSLQTSGN
jgi:hypothetical protein